MKTMKQSGMKKTAMKVSYAFDVWIMTLLSLVSEIPDDEPDDRARILMWLEKIDPNPKFLNSEPVAEPTINFNTMYTGSIPAQKSKTASTNEELPPKSVNISNSSSTPKRDINFAVTTFSYFLN